MMHSPISTSGGNSVHETFFLLQILVHRALQQPTPDVGRRRPATSNTIRNTVFRIVQEAISHVLPPFAVFMSSTVAHVPWKPTICSHEEGKAVCTDQTPFNCVYNPVMLFFYFIN